jgi:hypothetical protein
MHEIAYGFEILSIGLLGILALYICVKVGTYAALKARDDYNKAVKKDKF